MNPADYKNITSNHINYRYRSHQVSTDTTTTQNTPSHRQLLTDDEADPIRISVYYDPVTITDSIALSTDQIDYIKRITSAAVRYFEEFIQVQPVSGPLSYFSCERWTEIDGEIRCEQYNTKCDQTEVPADHMDPRLGLLYASSNDSNPSTLFEPGPGISDTDLILYVSQNDTSSACRLGVLAHAWPCKRDQYFRPYAGSVNLCSSMIPATTNDETYEEDVVIMTHEILHVLIMAIFHWIYFPGYDFENGTVPWVYNPYGDGLFYITSPKVTEVAQQHFNCSSLIGAPLENGGHWDDRLMQSEVMTSILYDAQQHLSIFIMALMEDSGWYFVDYEWAIPFKWGRNEGCEFFTTDCIDTATDTSNFPQYYCHSQQDYGCTHDYSGPSRCWIWDHGYNLTFQWFDDPQVGGSSVRHDHCPLRHPYYGLFGNASRDYDSLCWDIRGDIYGPGLEYAIDSRCVDTLNEETDGEQGYCMRHECVDYDAVNKRWQGVNIMINDTEIIYCDRDDKLMWDNSSDLYEIRCPNVDTICGESSRPFACFWGHWSDVYSKCICEPGYTGDECDELNDATDGIEAELATYSPTSQPSEAPTAAFVIQDRFIDIPPFAAISSGWSSSTGELVITGDYHGPYTKANIGEKITIEREFQCASKSEVHVSLYAGFCSAGSGDWVKLYLNGKRKVTVEGNVDGTFIDNAELQKASGCEQSFKWIQTRSYDINRVEVGETFKVQFKIKVDDSNDAVSIYGMEIECNSDHHHSYSKDSRFDRLTR